MSFLSFRYEDHSNFFSEECFKARVKENIDYLEKVQEGEEKYASFLGWHRVDEWAGEEWLKRYESLAGEIRKELNIGEGTVTSYLKTASKIGICDYSKEESKNRSRCRKVYCTTLNMLFNGATEAQRILGVDRTSIRRCCVGEKQDTKGRTDDERLQWMYYEDYLKSTTSTEVSA